ncbi:hypothetical protein D1N53_22855, partial [Clostridioides difficile]
VSIFLTPLLKFFGSTSEILPYAHTYTKITSIGLPFLIMSTGMEINSCSKQIVQTEFILCEVF